MSNQRIQLQKHTLGELLDVTRGMSLPGSNYATSGELIRLTLGNFDYGGNGFKENTSKENIYYSGKVPDEYIMEAGDIITPLTEQTPGLLGTTARIPESGKYIQSQDVALITCKPGKLDPLFCYYLVSSSIVKQQLAAGSQQTKIRHTSPDKIKACVVYIPEDLTIQHKIGDFLSSIDEKISLNRKENVELEALAKQIYDYWFVQFDFPDSKGRPYKSSGGKMVWNDALKRSIPEGWSDATLEDYCQMYQPKTLGLKELVPNGKYRVYGANGLIGYYDEYNHSKSEIAIACRGNSCGAVNRSMPYSWITGNAMVMKMRDESIHNEFIAKSVPYINISGAISGSGQPQLTRENLNPIRLIKPSKDILIKYSEKVEPIINLQLNNQDEIDRLQKYRDTIIPLIMNGQVTIL